MKILKWECPWEFKEMNRWETLMKSDLMGLCDQQERKGKSSKRIKEDSMV